MFVLRIPKVGHTQQEETILFLGQIEIERSFNESFPLFSDFLMSRVLSALLLIFVEPRVFECLRVELLIFHKVVAGF